MILLTGATGTLGTPLLARLVGTGQQVRVLVREPRRLGPHRVQVQIAVGNLADRHGFDKAVRGVDTVVHLAASTRDQARGTIEELNGLGTLRLLAAARRAGVRRIVYVSSLEASTASRSRYIRTQALARDAVLESGIDPLLFEASIIYAPGDPWLGLVEKLSHLPVLPVPGDGKTKYQPIWADDAADALTAAILSGATTTGRDPLALVGPETLTHDQILKTVMRHHDRRKPLLHLSAKTTKWLLDVGEDWLGAAAPATWDQAAMMFSSAVSERGTADLVELGVEPLPLGDVLPVR